MSLFVIADLHLSFGTDKPMDIFSGWQDYVSKLEENWQSTVSPNDTVVIPGDISWGMTLEQSTLDFSFLNQLNGKKIIMKGNHDYWWTTKAKMDNFLATNGFDTIQILHNNHFEYDGVGICGTRGWINENGVSADKKVLLREANRLDTSINSAKKAGLSPIAFLHYPPVYNMSVNAEILDVLIKHKIEHCFYGHIHGKGADYAINGVADGINYRLIASDFLQFKPLEISNIVQYYKMKNSARN